MRRLRRLRHRHDRSRHPDDDLRPPRHRLSRIQNPRTHPRSPFGRLRRCRAESGNDGRASRLDPAQRIRQSADPRLLRLRRRSRTLGARHVGRPPRRERRHHRRDRSPRALGRSRLHRPRAALGTPHCRGQRHRRRLPGRRIQDRDPPRGHGQAQLPPRPRPEPAGDPCPRRRPFESALPRLVPNRGRTRTLRPCLRHGPAFGPWESGPARPAAGVFRRTKIDPRRRQYSDYSGDQEHPRC